MKAVFDSDVLVDYLQGLREAADELDRYPEKCISLVSWMEVMVGASPGEEAALCRAFLSAFRIVEVSRPIAEKAVENRQAHRVKLPDAIIWATAQVEGCLFVTRNTKDFPADDPGIRVPYRIHR